MTKLFWVCHGDFAYEVSRNSRFVHLQPCDVIGEALDEPEFIITNQGYERGQAPTRESRYSRLGPFYWKRIPAYEMRTHAEAISHEEELRAQKLAHDEALKAVRHAEALDVVRALLPLEVQVDSVLNLWGLPFAETRYGHVFLVYSVGVSAETEEVVVASSRYYRERFAPDHIATAVHNRVFAKTREDALAEIYETYLK